MFRLLHVLNETKRSSAAMKSKIITDVLSMT
nr:MAG TPA: hypothetical protein [Caudoviricetes sp.]